MITWTMEPKAYILAKVSISISIPIITLVRKRELLGVFINWFNISVTPRATLCTDYKLCLACFPS
jgi:hypothetical protein